MIFSGCEQMKEIPFYTVLIHGLVRDDKGRKMSKSLGNGIDPLEMAEAYGADALRFNLITGNSPGNDTRFYTEKCEAMRNFANKIWNASRFLQMNLSIETCALPEQLEREDKWVLSRLNTLIREVTENLESFEIGVASAKVYDFIWDTYCDWYIELTKTRLNGSDESSKLSAENVLCYVLTEVLKLLHPFMTRAREKLTLTGARQRMLYGHTTANRPSRFLEEIPEENLNWPNRQETGRPEGGDLGGGVGDYTWETRPAAREKTPRSGGFARSNKERVKRPSPAESHMASVQRAAGSALQLREGDLVEHTAFGKGLVLSVRAMGGDALLEVAFDTAGTKKLMLKSAGVHMKKL